MISFTSKPTGSRSRPSAATAGALLAAASLLAAFVAGCSTESTTSESTSAETSAESSAASSSAAAATSSVPATEQPLPEAAQLLSEAAKTMQTLKSVHLVLAATNLPTLPVETVDADVTNEVQGQGQAVGTANFRPAQDQDFVQTDFLVVDKVMYTKAPDGSYVAVGPAETIYDPGIILDQNLGLAKVLSSVADGKTDGRETLDGSPTVIVSGTIDPKIIDPIVPTLGADVTEPLPIKLWIYDVAPPEAGAETSQASEAPSTGQGPNLVQMQIDKGDGSVLVTLSKWAEPVTIPTP